MREVLYTIPGEAAPYFAELLSIRQQQGLDGERAEIFDIGCSYGVLAALLKYRITLDMLYEHYNAPGRSLLTRDQSIHIDRLFFDGKPPFLMLGVTGLDRAARAVDYAVRVGLLDHGISKDLEAGSEPATVSTIASLSLIVSTGCVGYVGRNTFFSLLSSLSKPYPWIACFVLRMFDYAPISTALSQFGLRTERIEGVSVRQRRFTSKEEEVHTIMGVRRLGHETTEKEETGFLYADLFVSVPSEEYERLHGSSRFRRFPAFASYGWRS